MMRQAFHFAMYGFVRHADAESAQISPGSFTSGRTARKLSIAYLVTAVLSVSR